MTEKDLADLEAQITFSELARQLIVAARCEYTDEGRIEIDDDYPRNAASISAASVDEIHEAGGAYVRAWVWVPLEDCDPEDDGHLV